MSKYTEKILILFFAATLGLLVLSSNDWYYTDQAGNIQGPFTDFQMKQWANAGYFGPETMVQRSGSGPFHPISQSPLSVWPSGNSGSPANDLFYETTKRPSRGVTSKAKKAFRKVFRTWLEKKATAGPSSGFSQGDSQGSDFQHSDLDAGFEDAESSRYAGIAQDHSEDDHPSMHSEYHDEFWAQPQDQADLTDSLEELKEYARDWYKPEERSYEWCSERQRGSRFVDEEAPYANDGSPTAATGEFWNALDNANMQSMEPHGSLDQSYAQSLRPESAMEPGKYPPSFEQIDKGAVLAEFEFDQQEVLHQESLDRAIDRTKERSSKRIQEGPIIQEQYTENMDSSYHDDLSQQPLGADASYDRPSAYLRRMYNEQVYYPPDKGFERQYDSGLRRKKRMDESDEEEGAAFQVKRFIKGLAEMPAALFSGSRAEDEDEEADATSNSSEEIAALKDIKFSVVGTIARSAFQTVHLAPVLSAIMIVLVITVHAVPVFVAVLLGRLLSQMTIVQQADEIGTSFLQTLAHTAIKSTLAREAVLVISFFVCSSLLGSNIYPLLEETTSLVYKNSLVQSTINGSFRELVAMFGIEPFRADLSLFACAPFVQSKILANILAVGLMMGLVSWLLYQTVPHIAVVSGGASTIILLLFSTLALFKKAQGRKEDKFLESMLMCCKKPSLSDAVPVTYKMLCKIRQQANAFIQAQRIIKVLLSVGLLGSSFFYCMMHPTMQTSPETVAVVFIELLFLNFGTLQILQLLPALIEKSGEAFGALEALRFSRSFSRNMAATQSKQSRHDGPDRQAGVCISEVWYTPPTSGPIHPSLQGVSLQALPGQMLAVVGPDGAGKSTLANILRGKLTVNKGEVTYQGRPFSSWVEDEVRHRSVFVGQNTEVLPGLSVRDNIGIGYLHPQALKDKASWEEACAVTGSTAVVQSLPQGLDTLAETGALSAGQWQRLLLMRPILKPTAEIILLDEPFNSLPDVDVMHILNDLRQNMLPHQVVIIFSQKLCVGPLVDHIVYLEGGKTMEEGHHDYLMTLGGKYCQEARKQNSFYFDVNQFQY